MRTYACIVYKKKNRKAINGLFQEFYIIYITGLFIVTLRDNKKTKKKKNLVLVH